jgi:hypothetical protein
MPGFCCGIGVSPSWRRQRRADGLPGIGCGQAAQCSRHSSARIIGSAAGFMCALDGTRARRIRRAVAAHRYNLLASAARDACNAGAIVARMVKLVDTADLKSAALNRACRFDSGSGHQRMHFEAFGCCGAITDGYPRRRRPGSMEPARPSILAFTPGLPSTAMSPASNASSCVSGLRSQSMTDFLVDCY